MLERLRYFFFRRLSGHTRWLRARFTPAGWVVLTLLVASGVLGVDTDQSTAYQTFTLLALLVGISVSSGFFLRTRFTVRRDLPRLGTAGESLRYKLSIGNPGRKPLGGLSVREELKSVVPALEEFRTEPDPGDAEEDFLARVSGFSRWKRALRRVLPADAPDLPLPELAPGGSCDVEAELTASRRGRLQLEGASVARQDPFGLFRARSSVPARDSVLILPKRYPVPKLALPGRRRYQQGGVALTSSVGDSQEFMSLRDYRPGDPMRRIHWRSWAKTGKLIVKEHQDEYFVRHALVLDTFVKPGQEEAFEEAVSVAASFACSVLTQESLLDLLFVGAETYCFTAGRGLGGADRMLEVLAGVRACRARPFDDSTPP